jgi:hypothetical protein
MTISLSSRKTFVSTPVEPGVWRALLWHTGADLPGHASYTRSPVVVNGIVVNGVQGQKLDSLEQLRVTNVTAFCNWTQTGNCLYMRFRTEGESPAFASAQDWTIDLKSLEIERLVSDKMFEVVDGQAHCYGVIGTYQMKISAEPHDYQTLKFNSFKFSILRRALEEDPAVYLGSTLAVKDDDLLEMERQYVENIAYDLDFAAFECKDLREKLSDNVIDQQFNREDYKNDGGRVVMDEDTGKRYKADAAGYCCGVPCECLNGHAFDSQNFRRYRASYGAIEVDYEEPVENERAGRGVEVEVENGWKALRKSSGTPSDPKSSVWWLETIRETLPSGLPTNVTLVCVTNYVAHPPQTGYPDPDYNATPRKLRVTGTFHTDWKDPEDESAIVDMTNCYWIFRYLIDRYSSIPWTDSNFNRTEIRSELSAFDGRPMGLYVNEPEKLYNVIGSLQTGQIYGWQFCQYRGKLTARAFKPDRPLWGEAGALDILNLKELKVDLDGKNYVSTAVVQYNRLYSEDTASEWFDEAKEDEIIMLRGVSKRREIPTLLKNKSDAMLRYNEEIRDSVNIARTIKGIKLSGKKWRGLRQYDFLRLDMTNPKTGQTLFSGVVCAAQIVIDIKTETVIIDVKEKV